MEGRKCACCGTAVTGPWGVVIFPDFKRGWCSVECWRKDGAKGAQGPAPKAWKGPVVRYKWSPQGQIG